MDLCGSGGQLEHTVVVRHEEGLCGTVRRGVAKVLPARGDLLPARGVISGHLGLGHLLHVPRVNCVVLLVRLQVHVRAAHQGVGVAQCLQEIHEMLGAADAIEFGPSL